MQAAPAPRIAVIVLGMHRSGTSVVTRALSLAGLALPHTLMPPALGNQDGFWEPAPVVAFNERMLGALGHTWDSPGVIPAERWDGADVQALRPAAHDILRQEFGQAGQFILKDPRIGRLMPFWRGVLDDLGITVRYVHCLRNPLAVAQSLRQRDSLGELQSLRLWTDHVMAAEVASRGSDRATVHYETFLQDPVTEVARLMTDLRLDGLPLAADTQLAISQVVTPARSHHAVAPGAMELAARTVSLAGAVYRQMCCTDKRSRRPPLPTAEWQALAALDREASAAATSARAGTQGVGAPMSVRPAPTVDLPMLLSLLASTQELVQRYLRQAAADRRPTYDGFVDHIQGDVLVGWCWQRGTDERVLLRLQVDQRSYGPQIAALSRPDLPGDGRHGFRIDLRDFANRADAVIALTTWDEVFCLAGSGQTVNALRSKAPS